MKNYPCHKCIVRANCSELCQDYVDYFSSLVHSYYKHREKSRLMKIAEEQVPADIIKTLKGHAEWSISTVDIPTRDGTGTIVYRDTGRLKYTELTERRRRTK